MADLKSSTPTQILDILGKVCPYTLVLTQKAIEKMGSGEVLKVLCNHPPAAEDTIPRYCEKKRYEFETVKLDDKDNWELYIKKP